MQVGCRGDHWTRFEPGGCLKFWRILQFCGSGCDLVHVEKAAVKDPSSFMQIIQTQSGLLIYLGKAFIVKGFS